MIESLDFDDLNFYTWMTLVVFFFDDVDSI